MNKRYLIISLALTCLPVLLQAQGLKRHMADQYYNQLDYSKAAPIYDELAMLTVKGKKQDWKAVRLAAESNLRSNHFAKAQDWYEELEKGSQLTDDDYINYIDVLRLNGNYAKADELTAKLYQRRPDDRIVRSYIEDKNYVAELMEDSDSYKVRAVPFNTGLGEFAPTPYKEGLVYVGRRRNSGFVNRKFLWDNSYFYDLYYVQKKGETSFPRRGTMLGKPFRTKPHDGPVVFSRDGKMAILSGNDISHTEKGEEVNLGLYILKEENGKWGDRVKFPYNSKEYSVSHPSLSKDGNTLYFASDMPGGFGGADLYRSEYKGGTWSQPVNLGAGVNTARNEVFPFIADDGTLYFASNGHVGLGGLDIFKTAGDFASVENMGYPLNTNYDDFAMIVNEEGNHGYFSSNRGDFVDRIYETDIKVAEFYLDGTVTIDDCNRTPVEGQVVLVENRTRHTTDTVKTDAEGKFTLRLKKSSEYLVRTEKDNYRLVAEAQAGTQGKLQSERFTADLQLAPLTIPVKGKIYDRADNLPLTDVKVRIVRKSDGKTMDLTGSAGGTVALNLDRNQEYTVYYHVQGYREQSAGLSTSDKCRDSLDMNLPLDKIKKGDVFVINNIFYDYDKATLRAESESELNKLADFLLENFHIKVELSSHTDSRGGDSYNRKLSQKRAQTCVDYLIGKGVPKQNIVAKGYGETRLVNRCDDGVECTEEEHQQNRRTEIRILQVK